MDLATLTRHLPIFLEGQSDLNDMLVRLFGWSAALIHGDATILDRWRFLRRRLPRVRSTGERVLEVGCGTGAFTMGAAKRGYEAVGLSWDERNQTVAKRRAELAGIKNVSFPICDVRRLDERTELVNGFDIVICCEIIEHILDDRKLFRDMFQCLKPGGRLILTAPNYYYRSSQADMGPWSVEEDGGHVRRGYSPAMLRELCANADFDVEEITYVSHFFSQLISRLQLRLIHLIGNKVAWLLILPLRFIPPMLDGWLGRLIGHATGWPGYCIALVAHKKRYSGNPAG